MGGNDDLKSIASHSLGKFNADLVSLLWLVSETAQPFASIVDDARIDSQRYGRAIIEPHLTEAGRRALHLPTSADDGDHA